MGQATDKIEADIEIQRQTLRSHLEELEHKVKSVVDWRRFYREHTGMMISAAASAGVLLGAMRSNRRRRIRASSTVRRG